MAKIDKISPVVRVDFEGAFGRWTSDTVVFSFSTLQEAISGITYYYSIDNGNSWNEITTGNEIVLSQNANATYIFKAINGAGVESNPSDTYKVMIDTVVPSIQLTPETSEITSSPYDITYTVTTGDSGLKSVMVNGTDITAYGKYTISGNGKCVFVVTGNNGLSATEVIEINNFDYDSPAISRIDLGNYVTIISDCIVYNDDVTVTIYATENGASGLNNIQYRLLDENMNSVTEWADYDKNNKPVVNGNFKGYVEAMASDNVDNVSSSSISDLFVIDKTVPYFEIIADTEAATNKDVKFTIDVTDECALGLATITVNGVELNTDKYTAVENGTFVVTVTLNNGKSSTRTITISNIDKEKPIIVDIQLGTPDVTTDGTDVYYSEPCLTVIAFDMGNSGIKKTEYQLNNGEWQEYNPDNKPVIPEDFSGIITVRITDNAGNVSDYVQSNKILVQTAKVFAIKEPSKTSIRCNDSIVLHTEITGVIPQGAKVEWVANNEKFNIEESEDGINITITSKNDGYTTFTAILYDSDGNVIGMDRIEMHSKAGFFDKFGGFFRKLFGSTVHYDY